MTYEDAEKAGKVRVPNPLILQIDAKNSIDSGNTIMHAGTTVFITNKVPPEFLSLLDSEGNIIDDLNILKKSKSKPEEKKEKTEEDDPKSENLDKDNVEQTDIEE
jgi:hypothetical protein